MPIGEWQPDSSNQQTAIDTAKLEALIAISHQGQLLELANQLGDSEQQWLAHAMHARRDSWLQAAGDMSSDDLIHLMKALAIAEMNIAGCTVGEKSPVIYLNRLLKQRGAALCRQDLLWIKQHSNNRFLPNGPVL
jgi:glycerol-3-phosphate O-acyltransferase